MILVLADSENSKSCEGTPFSNVQGNEAEMCDGRLKGTFVSQNVINLSKWRLNENEISFSSKGFDFIPTSNKLDVARLKYVTLHKDTAIEIYLSGLEKNF